MKHAETQSICQLHERIRKQVRKKALIRFPDEGKRRAIVCQHALSIRTG
ncbi:hypothetical protein [Oxalobacter paraformigenes]|uniref:Uncharacterized protein n=1 Tax=Oxalobacter paraformigenes TaxID=556268 RepID=T5LQQ2_9BURK|nr:hypothetical protein [Oxalobacter paraformigenes]EQM95270.1 hypothetical protein OFAG_02164 [Oxalobacter paraformigenes]